MYPIRIRIRTEPTLIYSVEDNLRAAVNERLFNRPDVLQVARLLYMTEEVEMKNEIKKIIAKLPQREYNILITAISRKFTSPP